MFQESCRVTNVKELARNIFALEFLSSNIARSATPGQFVNIKIDRAAFPLWRRPMSICDVEGETVRILFNVVGRGTTVLARTNSGESIDVVGPLGHGFETEKTFGLAVVVAGGLGVAPFSFLTRILARKKIPIITFVGARTAKQVIVDGLEEVSVATDDGSRGYHGSVVDLLRSQLERLKGSNPILFTCGPVPMFISLQKLIGEVNIPCQASVETTMACGIGLCQGCPIETADGATKYKLACKDGPVFDLAKIIL
jgi:dihydroorotate dehydrogenase electron transfer subunit